MGAPSAARVSIFLFFLDQPKSFLLVPQVMPGKRPSLGPMPATCWQKPACCGRTTLTPSAWSLAA